MFHEYAISTLIRMEKFMIKVLHYCPGFNFGGIESRLIDWYRGIDRNKIQFIVIKLNDIESEKIKELESLGGKYYNLPPFTLKSIRKHIELINEIIEKEKPQIVHVHNLETGVFTLYIAKKYGIKTRILHARTTKFHNDSRQIVRKMLHKISPIYATDYFACSENAATWGFGEKCKQARVIKNGIEIEKFRFDESMRNKVRSEYQILDKTVIGTVGRMAPSKNMEFLIRTFKYYKEDNPNSVLLIVGDGPDKKKAEDLQKQLSLGESLIFAGERSDVWNYYMSFDYFIGSSLWEGFGTTAIEAQATGLPTIVSTEFPETVVVSPFIKRVDLSEGIEGWGKRLLNMEKRDRKPEDSRYIKDSGYDARDVAKGLEDFYLGKVQTYEEEEG